jgi:surface polysaccharide O-acyltransferase-like enzyme
MLRIYEQVLWFSNHSFGIYLSHIIFLKLLRAYPGIVGFTNLWSVPGGITALFLATLTATLIFVHCLSFVPFSGYLGIAEAPKASATEDKSCGINS